MARRQRGAPRRRPRPPHRRGGGASPAGDRCPRRVRTTRRGGRARVAPPSPRLPRPPPRDRRCAARHLHAGLVGAAGRLVRLRRRHAACDGVRAAGGRRAGARPRRPRRDRGLRPRPRRRHDRAPGGPRRRRTQRRGARERARHRLPAGEPWARRRRRRTGRTHHRLPAGHQTARRVLPSAQSHYVRALARYAGHRGRREERGDDHGAPRRGTESRGVRRTRLDLLAAVARSRSRCCAMARRR